MIYLIRHTAPLVEKGVCYGQTDLDLKETFLEEAAIIKNTLPEDIEIVYSSSLQRCYKLAELLFPKHTIKKEPGLMELHCGDWEMQYYDDIPKEEMDPWMQDYVNTVIPNGESYVQLYERIVQIFDQICSMHPHKKCAVVAHGGVLRSILSFITNTPLADSFEAFKIHYGCVVLLEKDGDGYAHKILSNIAATEQHKPSNV